MNKFIKICLWLLSLTPFVVYKYSYFPYMAGENLYMRGVLSFISISFLIFFLSDKKFRNDTTQKIKTLIKSPLFISISAFIVAILISTIFATNKYNAFWGTIERAEGFVGFSFLFSFFLYSYLIFDKNDWLWFFKINSVIFLILIGKEFIQFFSGLTRPTSFIDNPTFLSGYLLFSLFSSFVIFNYSKDKFWKCFSWIIFILSIIGVFLTQTRGTILGVFLGFIAVLIFNIFKGREFEQKKINIKKVSIIILCFIFVFSAIFMITRKSEVWHNIPGVSRVAEIGREDSTTNTRLMLFDVGMNSINPLNNGWKKLLIGWGQDNFSIAYGKYFNPKQFDYEFGWFDRSHNKFVDILVMNGILGFVTYLFVCIFLITYFLKKNVPYIIKMGSIFFFISYIIHLMFVFDQTLTSLVFFGFISFILSINSIKSDTHKQDKNKKEYEFDSIYIGLFLFIISLFTCFIFIRSDFVSSIQMRKYRSMKESISMGIKPSSSNISSVFSPFTPGQMNIRNDFMNYTSTAYKENDNIKINLTNIALSEGDDYIKRNPSDVRFTIYVANAYSMIGQDSKNMEFIKEGEKYFRKMLSYTPNRPDSNFGLAINLFYQNRYDEAFIYFEESFDLSHKYLYAQSNSVNIIYQNLLKYFYQTKNINNFVKVLLRLKDTGSVKDDMFNQINDYINHNKSLPYINFK